MHFDLLSVLLCDFTIDGIPYREFASIVYHKTDARVKWTNIEIEIGGVLRCQRMLAFLLPLESIQSHPPGLYSPYKKLAPKISGTSDVGWRHGR